MSIPRRRVTTWAVVGIVSCSLLSTACPIGENLTLNYIVPLGFGGAPGFYNPFGIVQALVNSWLNGILGTGSTGGTASTGVASGGTSPLPNTAVFGAAVTQQNP